MSGEATMLLSDLLWEYESGRVVLHAMPLLLVVLCCLVIAYRYYSAFLAARVMALDDSRRTPAYEFNDGQNYHPTNRWVLFGHHFAAISGAGPLIGPVLAIQYGYMPGLVWLVIGVCLAGAVQDMLVLAASVRRGGKSLAEIARTELGNQASLIVSLAILFIVVIALAGLGIVVVKALGGEEVALPQGLKLRLPAGSELNEIAGQPNHFRVPAGARLTYPGQETAVERSEEFQILSLPTKNSDLKTIVVHGPDGELQLEGTWYQLVPGSSWGTFTIACTIPIALFIGLYMYRIRKGHIFEASLIGAVGVLASTILGAWIPGSVLEPYFSLGKGTTVLALAGYGFIASVLPVWMLLCPRDYLSSFLKLGTIALMIVGVFMANPTLPCPTVNHVFINGGPTFSGGVFPFVFICIMCGAISGFHALVSSGTTPKMISRELDIRPIGYGAMLLEGLVGVMALLAAASLDPKLYYEINVDLSRVAVYQDQLAGLYDSLGINTAGARDPLHATQVDSIAHLDLATVEQWVGGESLRGRTGGAVTLAVGMAFIFTKALSWTGLSLVGIMKYWYHFAIMFEALFILTTIDTGTRIARFLLQEALGRFDARFSRTDWLPGSLLATTLIVGSWSVLIWTGSIGTIWPMFGIANQLLAVIALCLITTLLVNTGRARYAWTTILPMIFVTTTTMTAGVQLVGGQWPVLYRQGRGIQATLNIGLTVFVIASVGSLMILAVSRWILVLTGSEPIKRQPELGRH
jgi:carbon starvation protein